MAKSSALSRTLGYFKTADYDEARVALQLVNETMHARSVQVNGPTTAGSKVKKSWSRRKKTPAAAPQQASLPFPPQEAASAS